MLERWIKPEEWWLKVNCDGVLDLKKEVAGSSVIVRDCDGAMVDGLCKKMMANSALMAETLAFKDGIGLVIEKK
ncbi:hypothetical protein CRYUN_Cryun21dG0089700 [Craigia yunnanensis]